MTTTIIIIAIVVIAVLVTALVVTASRIFVTMLNTLVREILGE
jgi:hypothetical protein